MIEAGYQNGFDMSLVTSGGGTNGALVIQRVANDLSAINVRVKIEQRPTMQFLSDFVRNLIKSDAFTLQWGSYPTLDAIQMTTINSCRKSSPWYCDTNIQDHIDLAWTETNSVKALELRHKVMKYYHEQAPSIYLYENIGLIVYY